MPSQNGIRQQITNQIIAALAKGTAPWRRPWSSDPCAGSPQNAVSSKSYSGVNPVLLQIASERHQFKSRYWATYKQWAELGGQVMRRPDDVPAGQWGTQIVFCKPCTKTKTDVNGDEQEQRFWTLRSYTVFNVDQVLGSAVDRFRVGTMTVAPTEIDERFERAEQVVQATGADIRYGGNKAYYSPSGDYIQMPHRHQFSTPDWFDTILHELAHWTEPRLGWDRKKPENTYALGELIAELGACYLAGELGLPLAETLGNHASYLQNWLGAMQGDTRFIFRAAAQASKAADYILSFSHSADAEIESDREPAIIV